MRLARVAGTLALAVVAWGRDPATPAVHHTYFESSLNKLLYFKNPATLLGLDRTTGTVHRSSDYGAKWTAVSDIPAGKASRLYAHPFEPKMAFVLTEDTEHWVTRNEGTTWEQFSTPLAPTTSGERAISFHAHRTRWMLFTGERCTEETVGWWPFPRLVCHDEAFYTKDGFEQAVRDHKDGDRTGQAITALMDKSRAVAKCMWARHTPEFQEMAEEAIFCLEIVSLDHKDRRTLSEPIKHSLANATKVHYARAHRSLSDDLAGMLDGLAKPKTERLVVSEDFFATQRIVSFGSGNDGRGGDRAGGGVVAISVVKDFLLAAIGHAHSDEMDLFVSQDGHEWAESHVPLPPGAREDAYTVLESTKYAVFVDVESSASSVAGSLYRSNSNGTYYTVSLEHTHRARDGAVDVERVHGVTGVVIANQVSNWDQAQKGDILGRHNLKLRSRISFDDGATWRYLRAPTKDADGQKYACSDSQWQSGECALHVHSVTSTRTPGRVFGAPAAPGIVLAVGSVGAQLLEWRDCDTFLSRDGGLTWTFVLKGAHHVQMADSGVALVAVSDMDAVNEMQYSVDGGQKWQTVALETTVRVTSLVVDDDGLSPVVLAAGSVRTGTHAHNQVVVALDFGAVWKQQCAVDASDPKPNSDMEQFVLDAHDTGCVMGHRAEYVRRKADAPCVLRLDRVLEPQLSDCACTDHDFECDYNYDRDSSGKCQLEGSVVVPKGQCRNKSDKFMASSGYRRIPGDTCTPTLHDPDAPVERPCPQAQPEAPTDSKLGPVTHHTLRVKGMPRLMVFPNSTDYLLMTSEQQLFRSDSEGTKWIEIDLATVDSKVGRPVYLAEHKYDAHRAFVYTDRDALLFTNNRGATWTRVKGVPAKANALHIRPLLDFSAEDPDWLLFIGGTECPNCHTEIWASRDNGLHWSRVTTHATKCLFARTNEFSALPPASVVCTGYDGNSEQDQPRAGSRVEVRVFTEPFGKSTHHTIKAPDSCEVGEFHVYGQFMVFAAVCGDELRMCVSDDGRTMYEARFPPGVHVRADAFTLLPAHAGTVLLDVESVRSSAQWGSGWGELFASNSNGTHFHRVLQHTNRAPSGSVDVERVAGLRGMLLANRVSNADALGHPGVHKRLHTVASWDDGMSWHALAPPSDSKCDDCSLHLFGPAMMGNAHFGAPSAPGTMVGVGSVGTHLGRYMQSRTFMSRDGGVTWADIGDEAQHVLVDHGALIVLVPDAKPTDTLRFSADGGASWTSYRFSDTQVLVDSIEAGDGGGQRVLLSTRPFVESGGVSLDESLLVTVDFSQLHAQKCVLDERDHTRSDFELWTPRWGPSRRDASMCILGAETSYWRRTPRAACFVGDEFAPPSTRTRVCECSMSDYECDEGFWRNDYGECVLDGADPEQPSGCRDGTSYVGRSGYRRMAQTECTNGPDLTRPVQRLCGRAGGVHASAHVLDAPIADLQYFANSPHMVVRTDTGKVHVSLDEGSKWTPLPSPDYAEHTPTEFVSIVRHPYFEDYAYFVPHAGTVALYTDDEARTTRVLHLPALPALHPPLRFHPEYPDWLLFMGKCTDPGCSAQGFVSRDHGLHWDAVHGALGPAGCTFLRTDRAHKPHRQAIACARHIDSGGDVVVSENWFHSEHTLVSNATDFAIFGEFLLVSQDADDGRALTMHVSNDGHSSAVAQFPGDAHTMDPAYTVLEPAAGFEYTDTNGRTHTTPGSGLMMHVTKSTEPGSEWGTLYTSNSNGTYYRRSLEYVNRDESGLVDFERIRGLEGIALANIVSNPQTAHNGTPKRLRSMVTMDGGARWHYLRVEGSTPCSQTAPQSGSCALHLHGYTEVSDPENIYSAKGAIGLVMGVGNVGPHLSHIGQASTYLSTNGGVSWTQVRKGPMWHEFGDHGALLIVADRIHPVSVVEYSLDRGSSWLTLQLPKEAQHVRVEMLTTSPDSTSRKFVLFGQANGRNVIVGLDFSGAQPRACTFKADEKDGDFELFSPRMLGSDQQCLLGRQVEYYRRKPLAACSVGEEFRPVRQLTHICECTKYDYECNHNFVRQTTNDGLGKCMLIEGMSAPRTNCTQGMRDYFVIEAAYRKIPQSICHNGVVLDRPTEVWCPGKARSVAIFWSLILPIAFLTLAYVAYKRWRDQYPYLRLEDIGTAVRPALRNLQAQRPTGLVNQLQPIFTTALSTFSAVGSAARESTLWVVDKAAPYLPHSIQRWSYEHPPRWGAQSLDGRSRHAIRGSNNMSRFTYHPVSTNEAAGRVFGSYDDELPDEYDEVEAGFNHFLDDERDETEQDAMVVDRQVLFANAEFSDEDEDVGQTV
ncbi:vacuolar protein sorting/targeting protein PEP1 [Coemansia sp. RSA 1822]|nr:vacuolar protein sorting/targeting protein PEP1 [Coemansia sp. RSA 638]KAJ2541023.1 vacuolar protein sorting/targeting protein PEP1 [Coemansia sp. RSA 1853]KAJ2566326.1 vacuolar protein sorting/targeting protein PEP1 [Coemansia sp. RSA 1822]